MAGAINHRYESDVPDEGVDTEVGPDEWNDSLVMSGGSDGQAAVRRTSADDGWELTYLGAPVAFINATQAPNSGTGETDLHSFTIAASHFNVNKRKIVIEADGSFAANGNTKTLKLKFGASGSVTLNPTTTAPNGVRFYVKASILRTSSGNQRCRYRVWIGTALEIIGTASFTETDTNALTLKFTGQSGTASSDILLDETTIQYLN